MAAELSARTPAEGVAKTAPLTHSDGKEEGLSPAGESAVHPKLRQKTGGSSRWVLAPSSHASFLLMLGQWVMFCLVCTALLTLHGAPVGRLL